MAPLAVAVTTAAIASFGAAGFPGLSKWSRMNGFPETGAWAAFALILIVNAYGEETGWRGYALPRFRLRHDRMSASFLVFVPWALWHLPTFFIDSGYRGFSPLFVPAFLVGLFAGAVVLTWMHEGARSSILIVALWHLCLNIGSATTAGEGAPSVVVTTLVIVWAMFVARHWRLQEAADSIPAAKGNVSVRRSSAAAVRGR